MDNGIEPEVEQLLTTITRALRPRVVIECGGFPGRSTQAVLNGLDDGKLICFEAEARFCEELALAFPALHIEPGYCREYSEADLTFIDSSPYGERDKDVAAWWDTARSGAILMLHDTNDDRWIKPEQVRWGIRVPTSWGLGIYQR